MNNQSEVAIKVAQIVDDATNDNELYYEMCQLEIQELIDVKKEELAEEADYKRNYIDSLFQDE